MSRIRELEEPFLAVLGLVLLTLEHVSMNEVDTRGDEQTDQLVLQAE